METHPEFQMKHWVALVLLPLGMLALQAWGYTPEQKEYLWDGARNSPAGAATEDLGTTRLFPNPTRGVLNAFVYDAWGTLIGSNGSPQTAYLYTGEQFDPHLGFYYLRARYLNTGTGRFWTRDSWEGNQSDPLSLHKYLYCHADPVNGVDRSGHFNSSVGLGQRVHRFLGERFKQHARSKGEKYWVNRSVRTILRDLFSSQNAPGLFSMASLRRPDLASAGKIRGEVYEIKPAPGLLNDPVDILAEGVSMAVSWQLGDYIEELRRYSPTYFHWDGGTSFAMGIQYWPSFDTGNPMTILVTVGMYNHAYGVIYYTVVPRTEALAVGAAAVATYYISDAIAKALVKIRMAGMLSGARASSKFAVIPIGGVGLVASA